MVAQIDKAYREAGLSRTLARLASYALFEGRPLTTRGQWFNPVVLGLASMLARIGPKDSVRKPVFILGTGRTGTTLLGTLLSLHRKVGYLNEPKALWHRVIPDEDIIGSYSPTPGRYCLNAADAGDAVAGRFRRIYGGYLAIVRRSRVVDKYPEAIFRVPFIREVFPDAKLIWLVRNGNDTTASIARWSKEHTSTGGQGTDNWWGRGDRKWRALVEQVCTRHEMLCGRTANLLEISSDVDRAAVEWAASALQGAELSASYSDDLLQVRYEDLVSRPEPTVTRLLEFCELPVDETVISYALENVHGRPGVDAPQLSPLVRDFFEQAQRAAGYA